MAKLKNNVGAKSEQHPFHLVDPSALPFTVSAILGVILCSLAFFVHGAPSDAIRVIAQASVIVLAVKAQKSAPTKLRHARRAVRLIGLVSAVGGGNNNTDFQVVWKPGLSVGDFSGALRTFQALRLTIGEDLVHFEFKKRLWAFNFLCSEMNRTVLQTPIPVEWCSAVKEEDLVSWVLDAAGWSTVSEAKLPALNALAMVYQGVKEAHQRLGGVY